MNRSKVILILLAVASCTPQEVPVVICGIPEEFDVKVADITDLHGSWTFNDAVSVYGSGTSLKYVFDDTKGKLVRFDDPSGEIEPFVCCYAVAPWSDAGNLASPGLLYVRIPEVQRYCNNTLDRNANILVAATSGQSDSKIQFHSPLGFIAFKFIPNAKITSVTLSGKDGEKIAGGAQVNVAFGKTPQLTMLGDGTAITLDCGEQGVEPSAHAVTFYFCLPPVSFKKGVTFTINTEKDTLVFDEPDPVEVKRASITEVGMVGYGTTFTSLSLRDAKGRTFPCFDVSGPEMTVCVPVDADLRSLTPVFAHEGSKVIAGKEELLSGDAAMDFTEPVSFKVVSRTGESAEYSLNVVDCDIPAVYVSTPDHVAITDKETWREGSSFIIQDFGGETVDYGAASIKGRGNASWKREKKSYGIKLGDKPVQQGVLGLPGHKRWCMIAVQWGYLGNCVGYELARRTEGIAWQPHARYVEFVLNGKHQGTYLIVEQIRIDKNRVNIKSLDPEDVSDDKISGGYLLTYDSTFNDPNRFRSSGFNMPVIIKNPGDDDLVPQQFSWIKDYINNFEASLTDDDRFAAHEWEQYFDMDSYIDMWFVWETAGATGSHPTNMPDFGHPNSVWFNKDRGGKLTSGPCWDFDSYLFSNKEIMCNTCQYYGRLFQDGHFRARVKEKWPVWRANVEGRGRWKTPIVEFIDSCEARVLHSAERNQKMWTWTKFEYDEEYRTIRNGLPAKLQFIEDEIINKL